MSFDLQHLGRWIGKCPWSGTITTQYLQFHHGGNFILWLEIQIAFYVFDFNDIISLLQARGYTELHVHLIKIYGISNKYKRLISLLMRSREFQKLQKIIGIYFG